jgi:autophagy-related protein 13
MVSAEGDEPSPKPQGRKRYSSSFGHRYAAVSGGAGSEGSAGSGDRRDIERPGSASFLSTNTDDDDISAFVQDIDSRKPLNGHDRLSDQMMGSRERQSSSDTVAGVTMDSRPGEGNSHVGLMLVSESEVDERLRQMNAAFLASLEGIEGRRRTPSEQSSRGGSPVPSSLAGRGRGMRPQLLQGPGSRAETPIGTGTTSSEEVLGRMSLDEDPRIRRSPVP